MLSLSVATTLSCISFGLALPARAPSITNSSSGFQAGAVTAGEGGFLIGPSPHIAPPEGPLSVRPPAPFLWKPDHEGHVYINFTNYARPITWFAGMSLMYVHKVLEHNWVLSNLSSLPSSNIAKQYVLDRMRHDSPHDRIVCGGGFVWASGGITLAVYMVPDALCYNLGLYLVGIQLYADSYAFVEAEMQFLVGDSAQRRFQPRGVAQLTME